MPRRAAGCSRLSRRLRRLRTPPADDRGGWRPLLYAPRARLGAIPGLTVFGAKIFFRQIRGSDLPCKTYPVVGSGRQYRATRLGRVALQTRCRHALQGKLSRTSYPVPTYTVETYPAGLTL